MKSILLLLACATALTVVGCARVNKIVNKTAGATATLLPTRGSEVRGTMKFQQRADVVFITGTVTGLTPGPHGLHIHEKGDCTAPDGSSAGPHFNPHGSPHGAPTDAGHHGGDFGNIVANEEGTADFSLESRDITLGTEPHSIIGRAVIVHADSDDLKSQPAGKAGARLACGLVSKDP